MKKPSSEVPPPPSFSSLPPVVADGIVAPRGVVPDVVSPPPRFSELPAVSGTTEATPRPSTAKASSVDALERRTKAASFAVSPYAKTDTATTARAVESDFLPPFSTGSIINERYEVLGRLGSGGTATVFGARHVVSKREVALKVALSSNDDPDQIQRLLAESVVTPKHPNIVDVLDHGISNFPNGTRHHYIVMERLQGSALDKLCMNGPLPIDIAIDYLRQAATALACAHAWGYVHRDIKPSNLFVTDEGILKVLDFGIAKNLHSNLRTAQGAPGTAEYASPEQGAVQNVTFASDVYSLGMVAYELVTGSLPFVGETQVAWAVLHATAEVERPERRNPNVPTGLGDLIVHMLEKKPSHRPDSMIAVENELQRIAATLAQKKNGSSI